MAAGYSLELRLIVLDTDETGWQRLQGIPNEERRIDVWWFDDESSSLSLLLAHLITRSASWDGATMRGLIPSAPGSEARAKAGLERRIEGSDHVLPGSSAVR